MKRTTREHTWPASVCKARSHAHRCGWDVLFALSPSDIAGSVKQSNAAYATVAVGPKSACNDIDRFPLLSEAQALY
jgi:hypothetical protein